MCQFQSSTCKICRSNALNNNALEEFTSIKGDNSATNDSMVYENCTYRTVYYQ